MRDPRNYFVNPFDNPAISYNEMAALATDHIGKLGNQNTQSGGQWNAHLTSTLTAMADFDDAITDEMVQGNFRKARKQAKNDLRAPRCRRAYTFRVDMTLFTHTLNPVAEWRCQ